MCLRIKDHPHFQQQWTVVQAKKHDYKDCILPAPASINNQRDYQTVEQLDTGW